MSNPEDSKSWGVILNDCLYSINATIQRLFSFLSRWQIAICLGIMLLVAIPFIITSLKVWQQFVLAIVVLALGECAIQLDNRFGVRAHPEVSDNLHMFLVCLSLLTTSRYLYYRISYTLNFANVTDGIASMLLFMAELYAIIMLLLSFFQTLKIKHRESIPLDESKKDEWPIVDIYIPTYNEDVEIVRKTVFAALAIDYPDDKKNVYILDDGRAAKYAARRKELYSMCDDVIANPMVNGIPKIMSRDNNSHAKAGNINQTFPKTDGELVLILDCDHMPTRSILRETVGFFKDPKLALVQTPHWFFNPDPFERNLLTLGKIPVNNELFYKVLQKGNDFWNATFFCGSAAISRKKAVLEVGGIAVETVTEDCHTAFRLHSLGYKSFYYDKIMTAGLAPELLSAYVGQQVRWARGMAQILRTENPLMNPKLNLSIAQRLCYFSATFCFFYGIPRIIYAIVPTLYLLFGINAVKGLGIETLLYALPHIILSLNANHIVHKHVRYSFWNELFEFNLAFQTAYVTMMAVINPGLGSFNVTDKGMIVTKRNFDWQSSQYILGLMAIVLVAIAALPFWILLRPEDIEATMVNAAWCFFNLILLGGALLVCLEQAQLRESHRLTRKMEISIIDGDRRWTGHTVNVSETGARLWLEELPNVSEEIDIELVGDYGRKANFTTARIVWTRPAKEGGVELGVDFGISQNSPGAQPNASEEEFLQWRRQRDEISLVLFSDVKTWYSQHRPEIDNPVGSLYFITTALGRAFQDFVPYKKTAQRRQVDLRAQLVWEGKGLPGKVKALGPRSVQVVLQVSSLLDIDAMVIDGPVVGVRAHGSNRASLSLLGKVESLQKRIITPGQMEVTVELQYPDAIQPQQAVKVRQFLHQSNRQSAAMPVPAS